MNARTASLPIEISIFFSGCANAAPHYALTELCASGDRMRRVARRGCPPTFRKSFDRIARDFARAFQHEQKATRLQWQGAHTKGPVTSLRASCLLLVHRAAGSRQRGRWV